MSPPQQQFIFIKSMTKWTPSQILSIQCRLFESPNIIIRCHYIKISVMIPRLLQPNVMHSFGYITSGHVRPLLIIKLLQIKGKETLEKCEMINCRS